MFFVIQWTNRNQAFYIFEHVLHGFRTWWISWSLHLENFTLRNKQTAHRSSCSHMSYKICVLKNFTNFTEKHLSWSHLLIKFQSWRPANLLKRDSNTLFYRTPPVTASWYSCYCIGRCIPLRHHVELSGVFRLINWLTIYIYIYILPEFLHSILYFLFLKSHRNGRSGHQ